MNWSWLWITMGVWLGLNLTFVAYVLECARKADAEDVSEPGGSRPLGSDAPAGEADADDASGMVDKGDWNA